MQAMMSKRVMRAMRAMKAMRAVKGGKKKPGPARVRVIGL
jgi:hypothetical protein